MFFETIILKIIEIVLNKMLDLSFSKNSNLRHITKFFARSNPEAIVSKLNSNEEIVKNVSILALSKRMPIIKLSPDANEHLIDLSEFEDVLKKNNLPNDNMGILVNEPIWRADPPSFEYKVLSFAEIMKLRSLSEKPRILSACAVIVCSETSSIFLHLRSKKSATYPGLLHTVGGSYLPENELVPSHGADRDGLRSTIFREIKEEMGIEVSREHKKLPPILFCEEKSTGFIQTVLLGLNISKEEGRLVDSKGQTWEGSVQRIRFSDLYNIMSANKIVPSGKAHLLAWLALGAPGISPLQKFGKMKAKDLFLKLISSNQSCI